MKRYIIDSNILMNAKNFEYGFDICPGFWNLLQKGLGVVELLVMIKSETRYWLAETS